MLDISANLPAELSAESPPLLLVVVDTEEEFDWSRPLDRHSTGVLAMAEQHRAQEVFARYGVVPTYVVDYPVATDEAAVRHLRAFFDEGLCGIGAHLHPWVNPPHDEAVTAFNSYPGNLPAELEREKLRTLTAAIERNFGRRPTVYKAGRYGVGPNTAGILAELDYEVDTSVMPYTSFATDGGPDFRQFGPRPFWIGADRRLLEIPTTRGFHGALAARGPSLFPMVSGAAGMAVRAPGILARTGLLECIRLTPEGADFAALRRLTRSLVAQGLRVFCLAYHSPSLAPGNTPYVRDKRDLRRFLETIDRYCKYFVEEIGGRPTTPGGLRQALR